MLCGQGCPRPYEMFRSIPGLYPLDASITPLLVVTTQNAPDTAINSQRSKIVPSSEPLIGSDWNFGFLFILGSSSLLHYIVVDVRNRFLDLGKAYPIGNSTRQTLFRWMVHLFHSQIVQGFFIFFISAHLFHSNNQDSLSFSLWWPLRTLGTSCKSHLALFLVPTLPCLPYCVVLPVSSQFSNIHIFLRDTF